MKHTYFYLAYNVNCDLKQTFTPHKTCIFFFILPKTSWFQTFSARCGWEKFNFKKSATCHYNNIKWHCIQQVVLDMCNKAHYIKEFLLNKELGWTNVCQNNFITDFGKLGLIVLQNCNKISIRYNCPYSFSMEKLTKLAI